MPIKEWLKQILIAVDQFFNAMAFGYADETISCRCYRNFVLEQDKRLRWRLMYHLVNGLFFDRNHCRDAYFSEIERKQYPSHFRN
ncbi:DNA helicase UvrD [Lonepinella sp. BR2271]|uniref:DNA helicase UvrD n=1 Tax=Lonepinella sp. BR2271 TaxID=3434550 RepID=UPI003F6E2FB6